MKRLPPLTAVEAFETHLKGAHDVRLGKLFDVAAESAYAYWFAGRSPVVAR
jgi:hypothetical protein